MQGRSKTRRAVAILLQRPCSCHTDRAASCARDALAYSEKNYVSTNTGCSYANQLVRYLFCAPTEALLSTTTMVVVLAVASAVVLAVLLTAAIVACGVRRRRKRRHDLKITADLEVSKKLSVFDCWLALVFQRKKKIILVLYLLFLSQTMPSFRPPPSIAEASRYMLATMAIPAGSALKVCIKCKKVCELLSTVID